MDAVEALSIIHAELGFLVLHSFIERQIGEIPAEDLYLRATSKHGGMETTKVNQPVRIVGPAAFDDYRRQAARLEEILSKYCRVENSGYFYKVVALD
jgi:hypothetical protein